MGVWVRLRLSSMAFLNSADWATMFAVCEVLVAGLLVRGSVVFSVGTVVGRNKKVSGMPNDVICTPPVDRARVVGPGPRGYWSSQK